jgi:hypothetical protein
VTIRASVSYKHQAGLAIAEVGLKVPHMVCSNMKGNISPVPEFIAGSTALKTDDSKIACVSVLSGNKFAHESWMVPLE